ncbi:MAG: hypothetical protein M3541_19880 [Acidobacteriota bacterium]|nr:hypothetical protein [Acidobacteriota bacterium]
MRILVEGELGGRVVLVERKTPAGCAPVGPPAPGLRVPLFSGVDQRGGDDRLRDYRLVQSALDLIAEVVAPETSSSVTCERSSPASGSMI